MFFNESRYRYGIRERFVEFTAEQVLLEAAYTYEVISEARLNVCLMPLSKTIRQMTHL